MYGMPQPNQYAQFGYGYPGFPGQAPAGQQPAGTPAAGATQPGAPDPSQAQPQQGQQQWTPQDQNAYAAYAAQQAQPYWGGESLSARKHAPHSRAVRNLSTDAVLRRLLWTTAVH